MRIDVHAHFLPDSAVRAFERGSSWHGTVVDRNDQGVLVTETAGRRVVFGSPLHFEPKEQRVRRMDERGVDVELLSLLPPLFRYGLPAADGLVAARDVNDELSALAVTFPGRFLGLATMPLQDVDAAVHELDRVMRLPGIVGAAIGTHVNGVNLDADELRPFLAAAQEATAFLFIHPIAARDRGSLDRYYLRNVIGNPVETTVAAASLMLSGRLDELPELQVCLAHGGGYVAAALGRIDHAHRVRPETRARTERSPRATCRRFFYDCLTHDERALRHLIDTVGADRVVLGTDFPADMGRARAVAEIERSDLFSAAEKAAMLGGNIEEMVVRRLMSAALIGVDTAETDLTPMER